MVTDPLIHKRGQALVEFCIGLIGMLAVVAGVFQLGRMGLGRTSARVEATAMASLASMSEEADVRPVRLYIQENTPGPSGRSYSIDDVAVTRDPYAVVSQIVRPQQLQPYRAASEGNPLTQMSDSLEMMTQTGLVQGTGVSPNIPVMPIVRRLFFDEDRVTIEVRAWSVRTGGLY